MNQFKAIESVRMHAKCAKRKKENGGINRPWFGKKMDQLAKTVVEVKKVPLIVFKLCTNGKINIFGNKTVCKKIIDENQQVALNIQKLLLDANELGSDRAGFFSLLDNDGQPAIDSEDKGAITDCHYPRLPNHLSNTKFWGCTQTRKFLTQILEKQGFGRRNKRRYGQDLAPEVRVS